MTFLWCQHDNREVSAANMVNAYNLHGDVRVVARDHKEHDENLDKVMRKFEEHGLTLNYENCVIGAKSMEYNGRSSHRRGAAGLQEESGSDC